MVDCKQWWNSLTQTKKNWIMLIIFFLIVLVVASLSSGGNSKQQSLESQLYVPPYVTSF